MLAMNIRQPLCRSLQLGQRGRSPVDIGPGTSGSVNHPPQQTSPLLGRKIVLGQPYRQGTIFRNGKLGGNLCFVSSATHDSAVGSLPQGQRQGVYQDLLAGPCLTGKSAKAIFELKLKPINDDEITNE